MSTPMLIRFHHPDQGPRLGLRLDDTVYDITAQIATPGVWLRNSVGRVTQAIEELSQLARASGTSYPASSFENRPEPQSMHWLAPTLEQDVWAAGVTYIRSREARQEEAIDGGDIYARVYDAERPELFFKAHGRDVVGPYGQVGIRADATWSVPEPELGVVANPGMEVVGFTIGNDMSSRDIEGANPLYLPQAKTYRASCAIGPGIALGAASDWPPTSLHMTIRRGGAEAFSGSIDTSQIKRKLGELLEYLGRGNDFPEGVVLLTGTGIVPPGDFTLQSGDEIEIAIDGIGSLVNTVKTV
jgi:2-dehydro-3-deoxy-D-arabinonate dehydratase